MEVINMPAKIEIPNADDLIRRYEAGESANKLSGEFDVSRSVVNRVLRENDVHIRGRSEAERLKWSRMSAERRRNQVAAAHEAARGREVSWAEKCKRALTNERNLTRAVPLESQLAKKLRKSGLNVTQQKAVGAYNIDVAINAPPVAVEIFGGGWHTSAEHAKRHFERTKYLFDCGWHVLIIWVDARRYPFGRGAYDYIISLTERFRSNPPARCEYRVILGNGEAAPAESSYLNSPADIERLRSPD
jgi:very-short-patch-repair endonuclease